MNAPIFVSMALHAWNVQVKNASKLFDSLSDEQLLEQVAPGRNRVVYLLGHLIAVNDTMIGLFGLGERMYAHLDDHYERSPDNISLNTPGIAELREDWNNLNRQLSAYFAAMTPEDWFSKHTKMSDEDFRNQPSRNKMSVLLNRTNHLAHHIGQIALVR